ncbi:MAG: adenylate/guanylate cyclase domain-containing protein [Microscillaceae bacterium]
MIWLFFSYLISIIAISNVMVFVHTMGLENEAQQNPIAAYWVSYKQLIEATLFGIGFGSLFLLVDFLAGHWNLQRFSFGKIILIKTTLYLLSYAILALVLYFILSSISFFPEGIFQDLPKTPYFPLSLLSFGVFLILMVILSNFILQINRKFGPGTMLPLLLGKYHRPRVENRVFLFIDLQSSTQIAEALGHLRYSSLVKDCFLDLNKVVPFYEAEIYQYVGDEVVLTWPMEKALRKMNVIRFFFAFQARLKKKRPYYLRKYGLLPHFKAGANGGEVTATEIGDIKREIAYHGDVLNTAARIRSACNDYQKTFLVSEILARHIVESSGFKADFVEDIQLRGKSHFVKCYGVERVLPPSEIPA